MTSYLHQRLHHPSRHVMMISRTGSMSHHASQIKSIASPHHHVKLTKLGASHSLRVRASLLVVLCYQAMSPSRLDISPSRLSVICFLTSVLVCTSQPLCSLPARDDDVLPHHFRTQLHRELLIQCPLSIIFVHGDTRRHQWCISIL